MLAVTQSEDEFDDNLCTILIQTARNSSSPLPAMLLDNYCVFISPATGQSSKEIRDTITDCPTYDLCSREQMVSTLCHLGGLSALNIANMPVSLQVVAL